MTPEQIKTMSAAEVSKHLDEHSKWHRGKGKYSKPCSLSPHDPYDYGLIVDRAIELLSGVKKKSHKEQYIVGWLHDNGMWATSCVEETYDEALKTINTYKRYDKRRGDEYKYRIIKQTIQEEIVYDEL